MLPDSARCCPLPTGQQQDDTARYSITTPQQLGDVYCGRSRSRRLEHISPLHCRRDNDNCMISSLHFPSRSRRTSSHSDCTSTLPGYNLNLSFQSAPDIQVPTPHRDHPWTPSPTVWAHPLVTPLIGDGRRRPLTRHSLSSDLECMNATPRRVTSDFPKES